MGQFKIPSGGTIVRAAFLTMISLVVLRMVGAAAPAVQKIPILGAAFR